MVRSERYQLIGRVSTGSARSVWKARDDELSRPVAVKEFATTDPDAVARLRREARVLATLSHPNVVQVYELVDHGDRLWLVEEWVEAAPLGAVRTAAGGLTAAQSLGVLRGALLGLAHAHHRGVVHGDVSPGNILVDRDGNSRLIDFELASSVGEAGPAGAPVSSGTAGYAAPERDGRPDADPRSDVYSAAAVLVELMADLTVSAGEPLPAAVPDGIGVVLTRALSVDPASRQQDAGVLLAELEEAAQHRYGAAWWTTAGLSAAVGTVLAAATLTPLATAAGEQTATGVATHTAAASTARRIGPKPRGRSWLLAGGAAAVTAAVIVAVVASNRAEEPTAAATVPTSTSGSTTAPTSTTTTTVPAGPVDSAPGPLTSTSAPAALSDVWVGTVSVRWEQSLSDGGGSNNTVRTAEYVLTPEVADPTKATWTSEYVGHSEYESCGPVVVESYGSGSGSSGVTFDVGYTSRVDANGAEIARGFSINIQPGNETTYPVTETTTNSGCVEPAVQTVVIDYQPIWADLLVVTDDEELTVMAGTGTAEFDPATITYDLHRLTCAEVAPGLSPSDSGCS